MNATYHVVCTIRVTIIANQRLRERNKAMSTVDGDGFHHTPRND